MRLTDLLQLTNDLNNQTTFYLTIKGKILPLAKLKITADGCLLYPGQHPMSKLKIIHLVKQMTRPQKIALFMEKNRLIQE